MKVDKNFLVYSNYIHIPFNIHKHYCTGNRILGVAQNCGKMRGVAWIDATWSLKIEKGSVSLKQSLLFYVVLFMVIFAFTTYIFFTSL